MKIVNLEEFRKLPEWTWYRKGSNEKGYEDWCIKGETWETDFLAAYPEIEAESSDQHFERSFEMEADPSVSYPLNISFGRDGCFDDKAKFMIMEHDDLILLAETVIKGMRAWEDF